MATLASKAFEAAKPPPAATWNWQWIGWTVDRFGLLSSSHSPHYENSPQWTCLVIRINMGIENRWTCNYALIYMLRIWQRKKTFANSFIQLTSPPAGILSPPLFALVALGLWVDIAIKVSSTFLINFFLPRIYSIFMYFPWACLEFLIFEILIGSCQSHKILYIIHSMLWLWFLFAPCYTRTRITCTMQHVYTYDLLTLTVTYIRYW